MKFMLKLEYEVEAESTAEAAKMLAGMEEAIAKAVGHAELEDSEVEQLDDDVEEEEEPEEEEEEEEEDE